MGHQIENGDNGVSREEVAKERVLRIRALDPLLLSGAALVIGYLSYSSQVSQHRETVRQEQLDHISVECRDYTQTQVGNLAETFRDFRRADEIREAKQDDEIKTLRQIWLQMK